MLSTFAAALIAVATAQSAADAPASSPAPTDGPTEAAAAGADPAARFVEPPESGIPMQTYATAPQKEPGGVTLDLGVGALLRARTLSGTDPGTTVWGTDVELTPGGAVALKLPTLQFAAGYAARLTLPINTTGPSLAVLSSTYLRADWAASPTWDLAASASGVFGENSQIQPATTPGGSGPPPATLDPVRTFDTYPYVSILATLRATTTLSPRSKLTFSAGWQDVGGVGAAGQVGGAQPRTWGPLGDAAWSWKASPTATLTTTGSVVDSILTGDFYILLASIQEGWTQVWTPQLETTFAAGLGASNTNSITFLTVGHLLPVASARLRYFTDEARQLRFVLDASLAPYVDTYARISYQRITGTIGLDWYATTDLFVGAYATAAWVPYSVRAPESYGTTGASIGWAIGKFLTFGAGAFTQAQIQGPTLGPGAFRQWTTYVSLTFRDREQF